MCVIEEIKHLLEDNCIFEWIDNNFSLYTYYNSNILLSSNIFSDLFPIQSELPTKKFTFFGFSKDADGEFSFYHHIRNGDMKKNLKDTSEIRKIFYDKDC